MSTDPAKCYICGRPALWKVNEKGYCVDHRAEAVAAKIRWPIEKTVDKPTK